MNPLRWSFWQFCVIGLISCLSLLGFALYAQHKMFLDPCPLCIFQRIAFMVMAVGFFVGAILGRGRGAKLASQAISLAGAAGGIAVASRHVWLQHLPPDQVPACGPGLEYMLQVMPLSDTLMKVFAGSGECAKLGWSFLGLSMPGWTLIWYVGLAAGVIWYGRRMPRA